MQNKNGLIHFELTGKILSCCFEVMQELGAGFLESIYKNALFIAMRQKGIRVSTEQAFEVVFTGLCPFLATDRLGYLLCSEGILFRWV